MKTGGRNSEHGKHDVEMKEEKEVSKKRLFPSHESE